MSLQTVGTWRDPGAGWVGNRRFCRAGGTEPPLRDLEAAALAEQHLIEKQSEHRSTLAKTDADAPVFLEPFGGFHYQVWIYLYRTDTEERVLARPIYASTVLSSRLDEVRKSVSQAV